MRIVLIGFMATGKSSVAPKLAGKLGLRAIEMDDLIAQKAGKSVRRIFSEDGERAFRQLESAVAAKLAGSDNVVISTGGGVITNAATMDALTTDSTVIALTGSFGTLLKRIGQDLPRPLFQDKAAAKSLYERRQPLYSGYAAITVDTDAKSIDEVVSAIAQQLQEVKRA